jgi:hypothetical protein
MIRVEIKGLDATVAMLSGMKRQVRYAAAVALTRTAGAVKEAMPAALERDLERPTPFTKRGLFVRRATPATLEATVGFMDRQASYLKYQIAGGTRTAGARGIKLPGNIELNAFGNIPKGLVDKLKAAAKDGTLARGLARRLGVGNRRKGAAPIQLFYGRPVGRGWEKAPMGIWRRLPPTTAGGQGKLVPVIVFEDTPARYRPRFDFRRAAEAVVRREWDAQFARAFDQAMRSAR